MPWCRMYETSCPSCGWNGTVVFNDVRMGGPWRREDGTFFYLELICPSCKEQVTNPLKEPWTPVDKITAEEEARRKAMDPHGSWWKPKPP